ncbi:DHHW family protein [Paenibacillus sp. ACRRX]|uniref:DHHW family protein n=1 Tax=Paenibacillus sp. ACRRX TaxID=2918206 RepID=UPI001EF71EB3|nr:DHHW family protein [Paenibacillus sp. ACRRX]MCG7409483.1 DHHW family protein [Paenibacillus sp. ACRRX]
MNRYDKLSQYVMAILFLIFIGLILFLNLLLPKKVFSESENRKLEQLPVFSFHSFISGKFTSDFEKYMTDQFVAKEIWVDVKSSVDRVIGKKESNGVYLGKDGYLLQKFVERSESELKEKVQTINSFHSSTPELTKYIMLVPTAVSVLQSKLPDYVSGDRERVLLNDVRTSLNPGIHYVDVYPVLSSRQNEPIYYKTDHHWTSKGAFYAYQQLSKQMGFTHKRDEDFDIRILTHDFYGSLYSKSGFRNLSPDSIELYIPKNEWEYTVEYVEEQQRTDSMYELENMKKKDKYTVFFNGNHPLIKINTGHKEGQKLLVVKDSYANSFIPFLTSHFSEIYMVDLRYYEGDVASLAQQHQIHDMLILYNMNTFVEDPSINNLTDTKE